MASLYNKFLDFIGIEENDDAEDERQDDYYEEDDRGGNVVNFRDRGKGRDRDREQERDEYYRDRDRERDRETTSRGNARRGGGNDRAPVQNGGNLPISGGMKMIVYHPVSYEDTQAIIDNLKNRKPVIVNMEELEVDCAQRILDFLSGAVYALNGTMCKISRGIFVVAPNNYDVVGNGEDDYDDMV
jgi:cell division inhibitor SepF